MFVPPSSEFQVRNGRGGAYSRVSRENVSPGYAWLRGLAWLLMTLAFASLLLFIGIGVYYCLHYIFGLF